MGLFGDSRQAIQACIDTLQEARTFDSPGIRLEHARRALPRIEQLKRGRLLAVAVAKAIDADEIDRAVALLLAYRDRAGFTPLRLLPFIFAPVGIAFGLLMIRFAGPGEEAVAAANGCWAAEKALGPDIVRPWWSMGCGSSESGTDSGYAEWSFPVAGVDGNGSLSYMAEKSGGVWRIQHEVLETRGLYISVVPCSGEISKADARGKMTGGVERTGKVAEVSGSAPVATGDRCTVKVLKDPDYPNGVPFNCQVRVDCGHGVIYGDKASNGYNFCAVRDGRPVTAFDGAGSADSSDPMLDMNLPKNGVTISDDRPTPYSFTIALE